MLNFAVLESILEIYTANKVISVSSGLEAVKYVGQNEPPDLILMDMRMPEMDGIEATAIIHRQDYKGLITVVTANGSYEDETNCLSVSMYGFIAKPVVMGELEVVISKLL